jgi:hypothetical protein
MMDVSVQTCPFFILFIHGDLSYHKCHDDDQFSTDMISITVLHFISLNTEMKAQPARVSFSTTKHCDNGEPIGT